ncbi:hypothetical protein CYMTET_7804 [Cymbomonas tetramitiformis]|uniref:Uncharacterized protein n=1 Tax=Cymbomonas tetramitiformis TaxID=36881 RepID=A0AAE0GUS1_9CHLO|nr:hypothetical protein CYMTET_7804 [Cymbomonas tetramitiformis]
MDVSGCEYRWKNQRLYKDKNDIARLCHIVKTHDLGEAPSLQHVPVEFVRCAEQKWVREDQLKWPDWSGVDQKLHQDEDDAVEAATKWKSLDRRAPTQSSQTWLTCAEVQKMKFCCDLTVFVVSRRSGFLRSAFARLPQSWSRYVMLVRQQGQSILTRIWRTHEHSTEVCSDWGNGLAFLFPLYPPGREKTLLGAFLFPLVVGGHPLASHPGRALHPSWR